MLAHRTTAASPQLRVPQTKRILVSTMIGNSPAHDSDCDRDGLAWRRFGSAASLYLVFSVIAMIPPQLLGQSCTSRSLQTVQVAVQKAASDEKATLALLEEAEADCPTSPVVKRQLAEVYRNVLLDPTKADALLRAAQALEGKEMTAAQPLASKGFVRDKWALVVGISKFEYLSAQYQLAAPAKDAHDFAQALTDPQIGRFSSDGKHVHVLTDSEATLQNVMSEVDYLGKKAQSDDLVVIYLSSHGTSAKDDRTASGEEQTGYIVTYDTKPDALFSTAFAMEDLKKVLEHLRSRRVVVFLDTCFSGDSLRRFSAIGSKALSVIQDDQLERVVQGTGRVLIASSSGSQTSWESPTNSFFTECLLSAMKQNKGLDTVSQLFSKLDQDLPYMVQKEKKAMQTPVMWPQGQNVDIVIGTPIE